MTQSIHTTPILQDKYRYVNLSLFLLAGIVNSIPVQAFAGISPIIKQVYNITVVQSNLNSLFYPIMYVIMILPANYVLDKHGLKLGTLICELCMCVGLTIRCLINVHFYFFLLGTFITSFGFCFMLSSANKFANLWFPRKQIFLVNSLALFALFASDSVGFFSSTAFIDKNSSKNEIFQFFAIQSGIIILINLLMALFFKNQPKNPQNYSSQVHLQNYREGLRKLVSNHNYRRLFYSMSFVFATLSIIFIGLPWFGQVYNYDQFDCGIIIILANILGLVACFMFSFILKNSYKKKAIFLLTGALVSLLILLMGQQFEYKFLIYIGGALSGFFLFPFLTTMTDFASQTAFPIGQATSGGSLLFGGQSFGFILIIFFSLFISQNSLNKIRIVEGVLFVMIVTGMIFLLSSKQQLKRQEYQRSKVLEQQESLLINQKKNHVLSS